jgi:hypothetical protein
LPEIAKKTLKVFRKIYRIKSLFFVSNKRIAHISDAHSMKVNKYINKAKNRFGKILGRIVPYNTRYKPAGVCKINVQELDTLNPSELKVHPIYLQKVTTLNISEKLFESCSDYWKPKRKVITDYLVVELPNGRIYTDNENSVAVITQFNRVVENVSLSLIDGKVTAPDLNNIFEQRYFTQPKKLDGTVFSLLTGGAGLNNISHWFVDVLPRLHLLRESSLYDTVDWFLVPSLRYDYQRETLDLLGIPPEKVIAGDQFPHIVADCLIASTAPRGNYTLVPTWLSDFIQNSFMPLADAEDVEVEEMPYIYISRSDSSIRNVLNEKELVEKLKPYGFKVMISSKYSIRQKIKLFANAKIVMGACGAGLINFIFCKPGTVAIEIFNEGFILEPFYDIANKVGLDHKYIICEGNNSIKDAEQGQREHVVVEINKVIHLLEQLNPTPDHRKVKAQTI